MGAKRLLLPFLLILLGPLSARAETITVDPGIQHQEIVGFGAFGARKVWWEPGPYFDTAFVDDVIDRLGSTLVRTQIYWDGEPDNDDDDPHHIEMGRFQFGTTSDNGKQFPYLAALVKRPGVRILASVWTPPLWMKEGADDSLAPFCRGQCGGQLSPRYRAEFAEYLVAYVRAFRQAVGVEPYAISIQNEPLFKNPFESCVYTASEYAETLREVGRKFEREGVSSRLFGPEHMGDYEWNESSGLFAQILDDPKTAQYLHAFAVHGYLNGFQPDYGSGLGWEKMSERVRAQGKQLWMTETSENDDASWPRAFQMAKGLSLALGSGHVNAWVYWAYEGRITSEEGPRPLHHLLRSWFRYVRPGARLVASRSGDPMLQVTAFRDEGRLVLVVLNESNEQRKSRVTVRGLIDAGRYEVHQTTERQGHVSLPAKQDDSFAFPPRSVTTLVRLDAAISAQPPSQEEAAIAKAKNPERLGCGCSLAAHSNSPGSLGVFSSLLLVGWGLRRRNRSVVRPPGHTQ